MVIRNPSHKPHQIKIISNPINPFKLGNIVKYQYPPKDSFNPINNFDGLKYSGELPSEVLQKQEPP